MTIQTRTFSIDGMSCQGCVNSVKTAVSTLSGIEKIDVSLEQQSATVIFDDSQTKVDNIAEAIENAGFDLKPNQ